MAVYITGSCLNNQTFPHFFSLFGNSRVGYEMALQRQHSKQASKHFVEYYLLLYVVLDLHKVKVLDIYGQGLQCHDQSVNLITDMQCCHRIKRWPVDWPAMLAAAIRRNSLCTACTTTSWRHALDRIENVLISNKTEN